MINISKIRDQAWLKVVSQDYDFVYRDFICTPTRRASVWHVIYRLREGLTNEINFHNQ